MKENKTKKDNKSLMLEQLEQLDSYLLYKPLSEFEGWQNIYPRYINSESKDGKLYSLLAFTLQKEVDARQTEFKVLLTPQISKMLLRSVFSDTQLEPYCRGNKVPIISNKLLQMIIANNKDYHLLAFIGKNEKGFCTLLNNDSEYVDALDRAESLPAEYKL